MLEIFKRIDQKLDGYFEFRFHKMEIKNITFVNGSVSKNTSNSYIGVGIRCFYEGGIGFASTSSLYEDELFKCAKTARTIAKLNKEKRTPPQFPETTVFDPASSHSLICNDISPKIKLDFITDIFQYIKSYSSVIDSIYIALSEQHNLKYIYTSDGTAKSQQDQQFALYINVHAFERGSIEKCADIYRFNGNWDDFIKKYSYRELGLKIAESAVSKLKNGVIPNKGIQQVILGSRVVGTLVHEAIGHSVEADFVLSGSAAYNKLGTSVGASNVNIIDFGVHPDFPDAPVKMLVDDEGVESRIVEIVKDGILKSYLHSRETARKYGVKPTGNARALKYFDEPIVRMRNTCMLPGKDDLDKMIQEVDYGYYMTRIYNGQADINGEFNFSILEGFEIIKGNLARPLKDHIISGQAFDVLKTVDAISSNFEWLGGLCGKDQLAIVGQGGSAIRCRLNIGGK